MAAIGGVRSGGERMPLRRRGRPLPSLKRERTSSERGSPGRSQPRWLLSVLVEVEVGVGVGVVV